MRIFSSIDTSTQDNVQSSLDLSIVTPTQPPHASDRDNSPVPHNSASVHPLSTVHKKSRVPVRITTAANGSKSPVSKAQSEESDIVIASRSFRNSLSDNSFGDNSRRSARSFCGAVTLRARRTTFLTEYTPSSCTVTLKPHARTLPPMTDTRFSAVCTRVRLKPCQESTCAIRCVNPIRTLKRVIRLECRCSLCMRPAVAPLNPCHHYLSKVRLCHASGNTAQLLRNRLVRNLCSLHTTRASHRYIVTAIRNQVKVMVCS